MCEEELPVKTDEKILTSSAFSMSIVTRFPAHFLIFKHKIWNRSLLPSILKGPLAEIGTPLSILFCGKASLFCGGNATENVINFNTD